MTTLWFVLISFISDIRGWSWTRLKRHCHSIDDHGVCSLITVPKSRWNDPTSKLLRRVRHNLMRVFYGSWRFISFELITDSNESYEYMYSIEKVFQFYSLSMYKMHRKMNLTLIYSRIFEQFTVKIYITITILIIKNNIIISSLFFFFLTFLLILVS